MSFTLHSQQQVIFNFDTLHGSNIKISKSVQYETSPVTQGPSAASALSGALWLVFNAVFNILTVR